jgi:hypothetical protein
MLFVSTHFCGCAQHSLGEQRSDGTSRAEAIKRKKRRKKCGGVAI